MDPQSDPQELQTLELPEVGVLRTIHRTDTGLRGKGVEKHLETSAGSKSPLGTMQLGLEGAGLLVHQNAWDLSCFLL